MEKENPLYFGLDYYESVESRKNLLSAEMFLLNMMKVIRNYYQLRAEESRIKLQIQRAIKKLDAKLRKTNSLVHFLKIPKRPQKKGQVKKTIKQKSTPLKNELNEDLELELRKIQERLKSISR